MTADRQPRTERPARRRAVLHVGSEQLAMLLNLPDDVTVAGLSVDWVRDSVAFALDSDRFEPVPECAEAPVLIAELAVDVEDDGTVVRRVTWPGMDGAGFSIRTEGPRDSREVTAVENDA